MDQKFDVVSIYSTLGREFQKKIRNAATNTTNTNTQNASRNTTANWVNNSSTDTNKVLDTKKWIEGKCQEYGQLTYGFGIWLTDPNNVLCLPFLWSYLTQPHSKKRLKAIVVASIKDNALNLQCLPYADLTELENVSALCDANLDGADLRYANLSNLVLNRISAKNANFENAKLHGTHLKSACLDNANLKNAKLRGAHLEKTTLNNTILEQAEMTDIQISLNQLLQTNALYNTKLPSISQKLGEISNISYKIDSNNPTDLPNPILAQILSTVYLRVQRTHGGSTHLMYKFEGINEEFELTETDLDGDKKLLSHVIELINNKSDNNKTVLANLDPKKEARLLHFLSRKFSAQLAKLENKIVWAYLDSMMKEKDFKNDTEKNDFEDSTVWKLWFIRASGFSPLNWGKHSDQFNQQFAALTKNKDLIFNYMNQTLANIETTYERERIWGEGGFCKLFHRKETRKGQIESLKNLPSELEKTLDATTDAALKIMIERLSTIQAQIKAENNWWPSELLKQIDQIFVVCSNEDMLKENITSIQPGVVV